MLSIDLLYCKDCPHCEEAAQALMEVLEEGDVLAEAYMVSVSPGEEAETWGSIGSPTIHINGEDLEPEVDHGD
jgi:glutaredoxin